MFLESGKVNIQEFQYAVRVENFWPVKTLWRPAGEFDRLFFIFGSGGVQRFSDREWKLEDGDLVYIPRSSAYTDLRTADPKSYTILATIKADFGPEPFRIPFGDSVTMRGMWQNLLDVFERKRGGWYCSCMQTLYAILGAAFKKSQSKYGGSAAAKKLQPAVEYLTAHFRDPDASVPLAAALCDISYSRFRKLFHDLYGMSAKAYLLNLRIENACRLLTESALSVSAIAAMSGFRDEFYFSAVFKKITEKSPTAFRKQRGAAQVRP